MSLHNNDEIVGKRLKGCCQKECEGMGNDSMAAGGAGDVILRENYGDGGARDICGGQLSAWCGGSFIMFHGASLANWRSIQREGFRTTVGALGERVYLTRSLEKARGYMPGGAAKQVCGKAKKGVVIKVKVHLGKGATVDNQHHPMRTAWASNGFDSVFAPAGAIGVREENCVLGPSRIRILGLAFGYRSPCHYGRVCSKLGSRSCSFDHGGASGSEDEDAAAVCAGATRKRKRKRKSPSALRSGQVRRRSWQHQQRGQGST